MRTLLISGANGDLGWRTIKNLVSKSDVLVFAGVRRVESMPALGSRVIPVELDVTSDDSISRAYETVQMELNQRSLTALDILVNNAGVSIKDQSLSTRQLFVQTYQVNVFGAYCLTETFLPLLQKSKRASIIQISSGLGSISLTLDEKSQFYGLTKRLNAYTTSKAALNAVTAHFAVVAPEMRVVSLDPGWNSTGLNNKNPAAQDPEIGARWMADQLLDIDSKSGRFLTIEEVGVRDW